MAADLRTSRIEGWSPQGAVVELTSDECWQRLGRHSRGRLGVSENDRPGIYPVNYIVHDGAILFRTAEGEKLRRLRNNHRVVFEVDGDVDRGAWSVVVTGMARQLALEPELSDTEIERFPPWAPITPYISVRIEPTTVHGRQWDPPHVIERD